MLHRVLFVVSHEAWCSQPRAALSKVLQLTGMAEADLEGAAPKMQAHISAPESVSEPVRCPQRMADC